MDSAVSFIRPTWSGIISNLGNYIQFWLIRRKCDIKAKFCVDRSCSITLGVHPQIKVFPFQKQKSFVPVSMKDLARDKMIHISLDVDPTL